MTWVILEFNNLIFCNIISNEKFLKKNISVIIYFLIQRISSIFILLIIYTKNIEFINKFSDILDIIFILFVLMKIGCFPFINWYIFMIKNLEIKKISIVLIITVQKTLPLLIINIIYITHYLFNLLLIFSIINIVFPIIKISNLIDFKRFLILSSVNNRGIIILAFLCSVKTLIMFIIIYTLCTINFLKILHINYSKTKYINNKWNIFIRVIDIGGFPPFAIFWIKLILLKSLILYNHRYLIIIVLIITSCIFILFYLNLIFVELIINIIKINYFIIKTFKKNVIILVNILFSLRFFIII